MHCCRPSSNWQSFAAEQNPGKCVVLDIRKLRSNSYHCPINLQSHVLVISDGNLESNNTKRQAHLYEETERLVQVVTRPVS